MKHLNVTLPSCWIYFALAPLVPFVLSVLAMEVIAGGKVPALAESVTPENESGFGHLGDLLTYSAAVTLQAIACLMVIAFQVTEIKRREAAIRRGGFFIMGLFLVLGLGLAALIRVVEAAPYELTFDVVRQILLSGSEVPHEFAKEGFLLGQSRAFWATILPLAMGVLTVATATAHAATMSAPEDRENGDWEASYSERTRKLQSSFRASSFVLVTSAVSLMLFLKLPASLADEKIAEGLDRFALGLTMTWGAIMTLTLIAVFVPPFLSLRREALSYHRQSESEASFEKWIDEKAPFQVKRHLANVTTVLAPILVGPIGSLLNSTLGGG